VGIAGSYGVAWFGIRVILCKSRTAVCQPPQKARIHDLQYANCRRHEHRQKRISVELLMMLFILPVHSGRLRPVLIGFAIGESSVLHALRIAGGILRKCRHWLRPQKIVFKIKEATTAQPRRHR